MGFVSVDPSQIQFDRPGAAIGGFVPVDPSKIQFDKPITQAQPGLLSRIGSDLAGRLAEGAQSERDYQAGKISLPTSIMQTLGKVVGGSAGDILGETGKEAIPQSVSNAAQSGAQILADKIDQTQTGQAIGNIAMRTQQGYGKFAIANPQAAKTAESILDIGNILSVTDLAKAAYSVPERMAAITSDVGTKLPGILGQTESAVSPMTAMNIPTLGGASAVRKVASSAGDVAGAMKGTGDILSSGQLQDISQRGYGAADNATGLIQPADTNAILQKVISHSARTTEGRAFAGGGVVDKTASDFKNLMDQPLSIQGALEVDSNLGDRIASEKRAGNNNSVRQLQAMQNDFRSGVFNSGIEGAQGGKEAIQAWAAAMKMKDLERISEVASSSDNPAKTIATQARNLLKSPLKSWGYRPDEIAALESASRTGILTDALRTAGSRLGPIVMGGAGYATGGPLGGMAASAADYAVSSAARSGATALQNARLNSVKRLVSNRREIGDMTAPGGSVPATQAIPTNPQNAALGVQSYGNYTPSLQQIMAMPPAQAKAALAKFKKSP